MASCHTRTKIVQKELILAIRLWVGTLLLALVASAVQAQSATEAGGSSRVEADFRNAKKITILKLGHEAYADSTADVCRDFRLNRRQAVDLLRRARPMTATEFDHSADWAPCIVFGVAKVDSASIEWEISASGVAKAWLASRPKETFYFNCESECQGAVGGFKP